MWGRRPYGDKHSYSVDEEGSGWLNVRLYTPPPQIYKYSIVCMCVTVLVLTPKRGPVGETTWGDRGPGTGVPVR